MTKEMGQVVLEHLECINTQLKEIIEELRDVNNIISRIDDSFSELAKELIKTRQSSPFR